MKNDLFKKIDWFTTLVPFACILVLCILFMLFPDGSTTTLDAIRSFAGDDLGSYYLVIGLGMFLVSIYMAFSRFGDIRLGGENEKPAYSYFKWGSMMFTAGLAADILFYSLCEWILYANEDYIANYGSMQDWASTFPLFHWGPIPWAFYMVLAVAFGFMIHVRKVNKQKYSEACRPLLGKHIDGWAGRIIDLLAVFALIAGTATTFALATPLLSQCICRVLGISDSAAISVILLAFICVVYTICALKGIKGVSWLAASCTYLFMALLVFVLLFGGQTRYIVETGLSAIGNVVQNFFGLATRTDPLRLTSFPQNWTIFYWAYWMVWCVATPFFIGQISKGRTIRQVVLGGYAFGLAGTWFSFIILGNYGLGLQMFGKLDVLGQYAAGGNLYTTIISIVETLPLSKVVLILLAITMIAFYATSFDSISLVAASYSYKNLQAEEEPDKRLRFFWSILLILLPIAFLFAESSMTNLQTVSIIAALPIGIIMILMVWSFFKDAGKYLKEKKA